MGLFGDNKPCLYVFSIQQTECYCYDQETYDNLGMTDACQSPFCTANQYDYCGISPDALVYRKGETGN